MQNLNNLIIYKDLIMPVDKLTALVDNDGRSSIIDLKHELKREIW